MASPPPPPPSVRFLQLKDVFHRAVTLGIDCLDKEVREPEENERRERERDNLPLLFALAERSPERVLAALPLPARAAELFGGAAARGVQRCRPRPA